MSEPGGAADLRTPRKAALLGLIALGFIPIVGRFVSPTLGWGIHMTGYLPMLAWVAAIAAWGLLLIPPVARAAERLIYDGIGRSLFGPSALPAVSAGILFGGLFVLLRTPTHFLGDGVLVGELVGRGAEFRGHDGMDYLLHRFALQAIGKVGDMSASFRLYAAGSYAAGALGVWTTLFLLRRSRASVESRTLAFLLWILSAATLLFCGYVESYGFLSVAMAGFLWSGAMAQRGEVRPWVPGVFFGFALFFHLMAALALPALVWLVLMPGPAKTRHGKWVWSILLPALLIPIAGVLIHVAAGFDAGWFRHEFLESKNQRSLFVSLTGSHGLLSLRHWKDLANWLLLVGPVTGWLIATGARRLRRRAHEPELAFLLIQAVCFTLVFVLLDRKLGSARDWDIFAPHVAGFCWIAARIWEPEVTSREGSGWMPSLRAAAPWTALLIAWPWFAVNASREASVQRFAEIRADFPNFPRAYAIEELAKYFRDRGDLTRSLPLYEESVRTYPRNARTRILLGTNYLALKQFQEAREQFDEALRLDPDNWMALDLRSKIALQDGDYTLAYELFRKLVPQPQADPEAWGGFGYAAYKEGHLEEALQAFRRASEGKPDPQYDYYVGYISALLGRWDEAVDAFQRSTRADPDGDYFHALAMALEAREAARPGGPNASGFTAAQSAAARALEIAPKKVPILRYKQHIDAVIAGRDTPLNLLR